MSTVPVRKARLGPTETVLTARRDGSILMRSPSPLGPYPDTMIERLLRWAKDAPERTFIAQRDKSGAWRRLSYAETLSQVRAIGQAIAERHLSGERPIAILSGNDIEHALLALAAMYAGVPHAPISPAYSLISSDFGKLRHIFALLTPGLVFASDGQRFGRAIEAVCPPDVELVVTSTPPAGRPITLFGNLARARPGAALEAAYRKVSPDTIAKILFTSGSTGMPKGVINTQRMLCSNQEMILDTLPCVGDPPPVLVDWLPWNHTFGGNHNVGIVLYNGGTFYIDEGKPIPGAFEQTIANLREIAPTVYFNVPRGFEELVRFLRDEPALRQKFFSRLQMMFYAGAGLAQHVWDSLDELSVAACGERILMITGLGATETAPFAVCANWETGMSGHIGVPVPGLELKLAPLGEKLEARARGPNVTPGYWRQPELTKAAFDDEGFYCMGDAVQFIDPAAPNKGLRFDGRIAEDFKLSTGTWVSVGMLRAKVLAEGAPFVQDVVIAGHDRDEVCALIFPNIEACRAACASATTDLAPADIVAHPAMRSRIADLLGHLARQSTGSANRIARVVLLDTPASIDANEITDKGSINQRAVLRNRALLVEELYADPPSPRVIAAAVGSPIHA